MIQNSFKLIFNRYRWGILPLTSMLLVFSNITAQKSPPPYKCGNVYKKIEDLKWIYHDIYSSLGVLKGETVASVGAGGGVIEVITSCFIDSINWTIQDVDTSCLNKYNFDKIVTYHEKLSNKKLNSTFDLVIGDYSKTNLPRNKFDRVLLVNVYHEFTDKDEIMADITGSLKKNGLLVIFEGIANKEGKRHGDCHHLILTESMLEKQMDNYGYDYVNKDIVNEQRFINKRTDTFYTFRKRN
jgi:ubiquinone/menaquinone biosynthesis C-methylase UbiE